MKHPSTSMQRFLVTSALLSAAVCACCSGTTACAGPPARQAPDCPGLDRHRDVRIPRRHGRHRRHDDGWWWRRHADVGTFRRQEEREPVRADARGRQRQLRRRDAAHQPQPEPRRGAAGRAPRQQARADAAAQGAARRPSRYPPTAATTRSKSRPSSPRARSSFIGAAARPSGRGNRRSWTSRRARSRSSETSSKAGAPRSAARIRHRDVPSGRIPRTTDSFPTVHRSRERMRSAARGCLRASSSRCHRRRTSCRRSPCSRRRPQV